MTNSFLYDDYHNALPQHTSRYLWDAVLQRLPKTGRILDAGCGNGAFAGYLQQLGYQVVGVDLSESGIEQARRAYPNARFEVLSVDGNLAERLEISFDAIVSLEVVEHLYDPHRYAKSLFDAVRTGGKVVVSTPYHGYMKNVALALSGNMDRHFTALWPGGHIKFWSRKTLGELLRGAGLSEIEFYGAGRVPWLWKSMIMSGIRPLPVAK